MNTLEALLSFVFLLSLFTYIMVIPPIPYYFPEYKYALLNDFYQVLDFGTIEELENQYGRCIELNEKECNFKDEVYSIKRCYYNPIENCKEIRIG